MKRPGKRAAMVEGAYPRDNGMKMVRSKNDRTLPELAEDDGLRQPILPELDLDAQGDQDKLDNTQGRP